MALPKQVREKMDEWYRVPDWRKPECYPSPKTASYDRWAWEFLRRNDEFKKGLAHVQEVLKQHPWRKDGKNAIDHPGHAAHKALCAEWGILLFYLLAWFEGDQNFRDSPCLFETSVADNIDHSYRFDGDERYFAVVPEVNGEFLYRVNLNWPIEAQIQAVKRHAIANQKIWAENNRLKPIKQVRQHIKNFPIYLRAFDAFQANVTAEEIADFFSTEKPCIVKKGFDAKAAYNADAAARRLIQNDYRFIPSTSRKNKSSK